jgi:hypothetical protein
MRLRGRRIVEACGALWYSVPGRCLMSLPYQVMLDPPAGELRRMLEHVGAAGARFPSLTWRGLESGLYVFQEKTYEIESLHIKHRPRVRRALQRFEVRPAEKAELLAQGLTLNCDTMARQGRNDPEFSDPARWERLVEAAFQSPEISFLAAFSGCRMAAYMITYREDGWLHILHQMSHREALPDFPNHLLTYCVTRQKVVDESLEAVCYGCVPLFAAEGLHEYKLRFRYKLVPHHSAIQLHPALDFLMNRAASRAAVKAMRHLLPRNQQLETVQTVLDGARLSGRIGAHA